MLESTVEGDQEFTLCLTHDVDRPQKKLYQALYYGLCERSPSHLTSLLSEDDPYWQFEEIMALEDDLGVRSAFYFLNEPHLLSQEPAKWMRPENVIEHFGRYDLTADLIVDLIDTLDAGGWEVGLHGSFHTAGDERRLRHEMETLEGILGHSIRGGRQHHLRLNRPETWRYHSHMGLQYDASLGSSRTYGFEWGYDVKHPFDDEFAVFPSTIMDMALPDPGTDFGRAWAECDRLLEEARRNGAVMTVIWHPMRFSEAEFPGYRRLYRRLVERALEMGADVLDPASAYDRLRLTDDSLDETVDVEVEAGPWKYQPARALEADADD